MHVCLSTAAIGAVGLRPSRALSIGLALRSGLSEQDGALDSLSLTQCQRTTQDVSGAVWYNTLDGELVESPRTVDTDRGREKGVHQC